MPALKCPLDLWIYQEIVHELAPDLIIETGTSVSFAGNLTDNPEVRQTDGGITRATFRVAVSGRRDS